MVEKREKPETNLPTSAHPVSDTPRESSADKPSAQKTNETYVQMKERHVAEERALLRDALEKANWFVRPAAKIAGIPHNSFQQAIDLRHPELKSELEKKGHAPGRPGRRPRKKKSADRKSR